MTTKINEGFWVETSLEHLSIKDKVNIIKLIDYYTSNKGYIHAQSLKDEFLKIMGKNNMSKFSGAYDLYDHIMMEKIYPVENGFASDELECFEEFKRKTGGVIYQHHKIKVDEYNQEFVREYCDAFNFNEHILKKPDKRYKNGCKEVKAYTYNYWGKQYTLNELNKKGVYIEVPIYFNTLLDIIPYYPYTICVAAYQDNKEHIIISNKSYVDSDFKEHLEWGELSLFKIDYKKIHN